MASPCSSNEKRNFQCVTLASVELIKLPLIDILESHIKPEDLLKKINSCSTLKLSQQQLKICDIPPSDYNRFDVTLLYTLIRNLCSLPCPAQGWGKEPQATDLQISDDVERLRLFRNNYYAHATSAEISENEFKDIWSNLKLVISRIQSNYNKDYKEDLEKIEQSKFSKCNLEYCAFILDAYANKQNHADGEDRPVIKIHGENEILCGGTARFEADVKNVELSSWSVAWQKRRGDDIKWIDTSLEKHNGSTKRKLVINSLSKKDEGEYQAFLTLESDGPDYKSKNTIRLHVIGGVPGVRIFVDSPICFGSETIIKSEVSSIPTADKFEWQKSKDGDDFYCIGKQEDFGNTGNFTIPKATFADKLYYRLLVWNRIGESFSNTIFLNVTGSPPNITTSLETNIRNRSVKLIGNVFSYDDSPGILDTFWTRNDKKIKSEESGGKLFEVYIDSPTLTIKNVSFDDAGEYQLTATNAVGSSTSDVIVLGTPCVFVENIEDGNNGGQRISVTIKSLPVPNHVQWIAKSKDDNSCTPIDIYTEEYKGSTVSFPHPVLVVRQRGQLEKKCFQIEVTNFIGKTVQEISGISLHKKYAFLTFSNDLVTKFPSTKQHHLKYLLRASEKVTDLNALEEAESVVDCFSILQREKLYTRRNVIFLQILLKMTACDELNEMCINYALNQKALCYFDNSSTLPGTTTGFKDVKFHVKGDVDNYSNEDIDDILEELAEMLKCEKWDILVNGVLPSMSFILVLLINEAFTWRFNALDEQDCKKLGSLNIDYLIVDDELFLLDSSKGTVEKKIYKERCRDDGVEFAKLCNHLAQRFPQEKLPKFKDFISDSCQHVPVYKAHKYPGILKKVFVPRSDVLKDNIFPLEIEEASFQTSGDINLRKFKEKAMSSCYISRFSSSESHYLPTLTLLENPLSCKSHPISTIQYHQDGRLQSKNVEETGLNSKVLSHVLSNDECLQALNVSLKNLKLRLEKIPNNVSGVNIHVEEGTLENEKLEEMYRTTQKYCQEQFEIYACDLDDRRVSYADSKFRKFLDGPGNKVSIFFSEDKMSVVGHDEDIACFRDSILTSVLHDEVITDSMNLDDEQFLYLNIINLQIKRKFSVDFELEDNTCSEKNGTCSARFSGLKEDVVNAKREVRRRLEKYDKHFLRRQLNNNERLLFQEKRVNHHICGELKRRNCSYLVVEDMLYVASETKGVDCFKSYLENALFVEIKRTLCDLERIIFLSDEWVNKKYPLLRNNTKRKVIVSVFGNDLVATCLPEVREQVESSLEDFLNEKIKLKIVEWKCADDIKELCLSEKKEEIMKMLESKKDEMVSISLKDDGVHLRGTDIGINSCQAMLGSTIDDRKMYRTTFTASSEAVINQLSNPATKRKLQEVEKKTRCVINVKSHCKIIMKNGNIAEEDVDVLVNSVHTDTNFFARPSTVARAIFEKGGTDFQNKLVRKTSGRMEYGHIAVTEGDGNLRCKAVYHACFDKTPSSQEEEVRKIAKMCLEKAVRDGFTSLSFPALGTGVYNYSGAESAKGLFDAIIEFSDTNLLKKIDIVLFEGAHQDVRESYQREYRNRFCRDSTSALNSLTKGCITAGNVTIVAENQQNIDNARKELENLLTALSTEDQQ